jgi:serine/threonine protein kinase
VLNGGYRVTDKLGFGGYSTVWLALDTHLKQYVAVKVNITDSVPRETKALKDLAAPVLPKRSRRNSIPVSLDEFEVQSLILTGVGKTWIRAH